MQQLQLLYPIPASIYASWPALTALNVEQRIDAFNGLQRNRGDGRRLFARWGVGGDVGQFEELPPRMRQRVPSGVRHCCAGQVVSGLVQHLFQRISSSGGFRHEH
jgi:hypothetical protein